MVRSQIHYLLAATLVIGSGLVAYARFAGGTMYIDEIAYAQLGYALLHGHLGTASTFRALYARFGLATCHFYTPYRHISCVEPWLDHPPLMGFLMVSVLAAGLAPRFLPVALSSVTGLVMFTMLRKRFVLATATVFSFVFYEQYYQLLSMVFLEAGVSIFLTSTIALTYWYRRVKDNRLLLLAGVTAGLATLSKEIGVTSILYLILYAIYDVHQRKTDKRIHLKAIILASSIGAAWPIYSLVLQPKLFLDLIAANSGRSILGGWSLFITAESTIGIVMFSDHSYAWDGFDHVLIASWLVVAYLFVKRRGMAELKLGFLSYGFMFLLLRYPAFYQRIPFFPFYCVAFGAVAEDVYFVSRRVVERLKCING